MSHHRPFNSPSLIADLKLVLLGESAVGKSSLAQRFTTDTFDDNKESTIGALFITKKVYIETTDDHNTNARPSSSHPDSPINSNLKLINFQIWDTAGQERYKSLTPMYYRNANILVIVFDVTDPTSFKKLDNWYNELKISNSYDLDDLKVFIVGNKSDLVDEVPKYESSFITPDIKVIYTSAKTGEGVEELFEVIKNSVDDSMFAKVDDLENANGANRNKSSIIDLNEFNSSLNGANCSC